MMIWRQSCLKERFYETTRFDRFKIHSKESSTNLSALHLTPEMSETASAQPDVIQDMINEGGGIEEEDSGEGMSRAVSHLRMKLTSAQVSDLHMQDAPSSIWSFDKVRFCSFGHIGTLLSEHSLICSHRKHKRKIFVRFSVKSIALSKPLNAARPRSI